MMKFSDNPNGTLVKYKLDKVPLEKIIVDEGENEVLEDMIQTKNAIYLKKLKNGISSITQINLNNNHKTSLNLPYKGYAYLKPPFPIPPFYSNSNNLYFAMESWNKEINGYYYNPNSKNIYCIHIYTFEVE